MNKKNDIKTRLSDQQYAVTQMCSTEPPFTGEYWDHHEDGEYCCVCCDEVLFDSRHKYDSGTGWPSFWQAAASQGVQMRADRSYGMVRQEIICPHCQAHLGHVFSDGPPPSKQRFCVNSAALGFKPRQGIK